MEKILQEMILEPIVHVGKYTIYEMLSAYLYSTTDISVLAVP